MNNLYRYVILISGGSAVGPLIASYMVQYSPGNWRDYMWLCAALAGFNLILLILFYPESNFHRPPLPTGSEHSSTNSQHVADSQSPNDIEGKSEEFRTENQNTTTVQPTNVQHVNHIKVPWHSIWFSFMKIDHSVNFFKAFLHPFVFLAYPQVLWAIFVYGTALASQVILM